MTRDRHLHELALPGLCGRKLKRYPHLVFYIEHGDHIDIWRVLHAQRDIPAWMQEPEGPQALFAGRKVIKRRRRRGRTPTVFG